MIIITSQYNSDREKGFIGKKSFIIGTRQLQSLP